jgi:hypothetical protein
MYTGPESKPYMAITPPWPYLPELLREMGMDDEAATIAEALASIGWRG